MNYEILKKALTGGVVMVAPLEDGRKLVTDGCVMCLVPGDFATTETHYRPETEWPKVRAGMVKMWLGLSDKERTTLESGDVHAYYSLGFIRVMKGEDGVKAVINETYHRLFDESAEWSGTAHDKPLYIKESGEIIGILMPLRIDTTKGEVVEPPSEEILYPKPEDVDDEDDEDDECPYCDGTGIRTA